LQSILPTIRPSLAILAGLALLATACSAPGAPTGSPGSPETAAPTATIAPTGLATTSPEASPTLPPASPDAWLAVGRNGAAGLEVILASTREKMLDLPIGVPAGDDWGRIFTATPVGDKTKIRDVVVQPGLGGPEAAIDGTWQLPRIGTDPLPVGLSSDGSILVLVDAAPAASTSAGTTTRFAVLKAVGLAGPARIITLHGRFDYDALSPDGSTLYVVEHLDADAGGVYQVRAVDVASGALKDGVIADKRNLDEQMAGYPLAQVRRADGIVLTLYRGREHPFIHALSTVEGWAVCIDLPATRAHDDAAAADWGLAPSPDGRSVYAVNATLGLVEEVDPTQQTVRRSTTVKPLAGGGIVLAKFGHQESGPTGRRGVVGPGGRTLYAAGAGGILAIDTATLEAAGGFMPGKAVESLAITPDGGTLYALLQNGHIVKLDATTGRLLATVPGDGYDRLVAVVPW
jgi:DNA-binding beta-propeller fold protein YncE